MSEELEAAEAPRLGARIRELRQVQGMTLEALAERSGVSRAMISKVERGDNNPTLLVAVRLAAGLGVGLTDLLAKRRPHQPRVHLPPSAQPTFRDSQSGIVRQLLSPVFEAHGVEFIRLTLPAQTSTGELPAYRAGVGKSLAVEKGTLRIDFPDGSVTVAAEEAFYFESDVPHAFVNVGRGPCVFYVVKVGAPSPVD
ncbi:helix-turn-helix transcriptional regulator [Pyxidicoccus parkwayensis]|uniref:Helix-turn-helix transcriptional regulator n=1 Tax=Pyxidicoccus parkwayensis TaxID=2813578 RepID=A0ABX7NUD2_9BACT|nr:XRE family transcriptional regulator [Pyxidicoccus parkwaysis]QSQ21067.1 helix-turn-helix transcriptional regulator [Pyxidicoccus parkwaysis]